MITLRSFMEVIDYKISETADYQWACYGPNASIMDYWNGKHVDSVCISVVFDRVDQTVYEMQAWDGTNNREYRLFHPDYEKSYKKESKKRGLRHEQSIDKNKFIDLETDEDMLEKARAIFLGEEYDTRIIVPLDLTDDEKFQLMELAHEKDITMNQLVENILKEEIERLR